MKKPIKNPFRFFDSNRFQTRGLFAFLTFLSIILVLATLPIDPKTSKKITLTLSQVVRAAEQGHIETASIQANPRKGNNWYEIEGKIKQGTDGEVLALSPNKREHLALIEKKYPNIPLLFEAEGRLTDSRFNQLIGVNSGNITEKPAGGLLSDIIMSLLPVLIIITLLYFLFVRQIRSAGKGAMSFGKSRAKLLEHNREKITFEEVAGCDEAKEEVKEIVEFLKDPKKFQKMGANIPKGCLLVGPPGTGKTLLARAIAGQAEVPFFSISGSDFVEMFVGVGASRVRDLFEQGRKNAPCIIFIDEIDAVGRQRGAGLGGGNDEREQTLNSLLVEMDGFDGREGVIIVAATNRPDVLDNALLRPGRFDRQIYIDLPDLIGRQEVLKVHAKKILLDKEVSLKNVARNTPGFSGADLKNLLNEAALLAARKNKEKVEQEDIDASRDKIAFGRERKKLMDQEDKRIIAYHEAGHALVQAIIDDGHMPIHKVTIIPRGQSLGSTMFMPKKDMLNYAKNRLINQICTAMGGRAAEATFMDDITSGAAGDIRSATKMARHMVCDWGMASLGPVALGDNQEHLFLGKEIARTQNYSEQTAQQIDSEIHNLIETQYQRAKSIIEAHREQLEAIANALLEKETLDGKWIYQLLSKELPSSFLGKSEKDAETALIKPPSQEESKTPEISSENKS